MRWIKHGFASSIHSFFSQTSPTVRSQPTDCTEEVRQAMLHLLGDRVEDRSTAQLVRRLRMAENVQELWFVRDGLMSALAVLYGESLARQKIHALNALFEGQIPSNLYTPRQTRSLGGNSLSN
ncbi:hypothetical protein ACO2Q9_10790 [Variovorax sp. VNK109]|uniref:hypothetical protein n=1 Tax=Variovorax sp. VNK109 TaxID=3400919 RepID=UPI003BFC20CA